jgi:hypothetical protein
MKELRDFRTFLLILLALFVGMNECSFAQEQQDIVMPEMGGIETATASVGISPKRGSFFSSLTTHRNNLRCFLAYIDQVKEGIRCRWSTSFVFATGGFSVRFPR